MYRVACVLLAAVFFLVTAGFRESYGQDKAAANDPIPRDFSKALDKAKALELYSLDPGVRPAKGDADFHGWKILGKTGVKKETLATLVAAFKKGAQEADQSVSAGCFRPRHGIRVQVDGRPYDFVICFECVQVILYKDKEDTDGFHVSRSPTTVFNKVLHDAKVKLPEQP